SWMQIEEYCDRQRVFDEEQRYIFHHHISALDEALLAYKAAEKGQGNGKPRVRTLTQVSLANFENRMKVLAQRAVRKSNEGMKDVALATINALITDTPKKTNQAAANWQAA